MGRTRPNRKFFFSLGQDWPRHVGAGPASGWPSVSSPAGGENYFSPTPPPACNMQEARLPRKECRGEDCGGAAVSWPRGRRRCGCSQAAERKNFLPLPLFFFRFQYFSLFLPFSLFSVFFSICFRFIPFSFPLSCCFSLSLRSPLSLLPSVSSHLLFSSPPFLL